MNTSLSVKQNLNTVSLDFVRYANVWEDAQVLLKGLNLAPDKRILSVCSAGDNCFALLTTQPEILVAVDVNPVQLYLTQLKAEAIRLLDYEKLLAFLGFTPSEERIQIFTKIKTELPHDARRYWEEHTDMIKEGVIHSGKFEKYFRLFANRVLPLIHNKKRIDKLLEAKDENRQLQYYQEIWNNRRWSFLFKFFFGRKVMGRMGRDPAFFNQVQTSVGEEIYLRSAQHLSKVAAQNNPFLQYTLSGHFGDKLPFYLQVNNIEKVRANLDRLQIRKGYVQEIGVQTGGFHAMNLSDIFEYMPENVFHHTVEQLSESAAIGCQFGYWNLLVPRIMADTVENLTHHSEYSKALSEEDNGFFYEGFKLDTKIS